MKSLYQTFRDLAYKTWNDLGKARALDFQLKEESITDFLIMEFKYRHPQEIITKTFNRQDESKNGADWEWWFINKDKSKGFGFRVQAKILNLKENKFLQLDYEDQTSKLIQQAEASNPPLIPLYCLYLHDDTKLPTQFFHHGVNELYGCSIIHANLVQEWKSTNKIKNKKKLEFILPYLLPWHNLIFVDFSILGMLLSKFNGEKFPTFSKDISHLGLMIDSFDDVESIKLPQYILDMINKKEFNQHESNDADLAGIAIFINDQV